MPVRAMNALLLPGYESQLSGNDACEFRLRSSFPKGESSMASTNPSAVTMKPTLGLTGVTINAMALIAPGAFLWTTYQLQAVPGSAPNMWFSVFIATAIAMLTAVAYAPPSRRHPEGGAGRSCYYT